MASEATAIMKMSSLKNDHQEKAEPTAEATAAEMGVMMEITPRDKDSGEKGDDGDGGDGPSEPSDHSSGSSSSSSSSSNKQQGHIMGI